MRAKKYINNSYQQLQVQEQAKSMSVQLILWHFGINKFRLIAKAQGIKNTI